MTIVLRFQNLVIICLASFSFIGCWSEEDEKRERQDFITFLDEPHSLDEDEIAYTKTALNLRTSPTVSSKIIVTIPKNTRVVRAKVIYNRNGDWLLVTYKRTRGWVNGRYLRPVKYSEKIYYFTGALEIAQRMLFPEDTLIGKILGFLIGAVFVLVVNFAWWILIGPYNRLLLFSSEYGPDEVSAGIPIAYYFFKMTLMETYSANELAWAVLIAAFAGCFVGIPISFLCSFIRDEIF